VEAGSGEKDIFGSRIILLFLELQGKEERVGVHFSFEAATCSGREFGGCSNCQSDRQTDIVLTMASLPCSWRRPSSFGCHGQPCPAVTLLSYI